jgi:glycerophosphoryl diester phosphodiesterase
VHFSLATRKLMKKAEKKNLSVTIWTADNPRWIKRAFDLGLYAVITNNPRRLLAKRAEIESK